MKRIHSSHNSVLHHEAHGKYNNLLYKLVHRLSSHVNLDSMLSSEIRLFVDLLRFQVNVSNIFEWAFVSYYCRSSNVRNYRSNKSQKVGNSWLPVFRFSILYRKMTSNFGSGQTCQFGFLFQYMVTESIYRQFRFRYAYVLLILNSINI